jgi:hypothetical protein
MSNTDLALKVWVCSKNKIEGLHLLLKQKNKINIKMKVKLKINKTSTVKGKNN